MAKETYLIYQTTLHVDGAIYVKEQGDYEVTTHEDGITETEIKGWIRHDHIRYAASLFLPSERIPVKRTRPKKGIDRLTTNFERGQRKGRLETNIVKIEKEVAEPQLTFL